MKTALCILAVWTLAAAADNKPNFSGDWKMDPGKSVFGSIPAPTSLSRRIVHSDPTLTITEEQKGGSGNYVSTRRYTTDGKQAKFLVNGTNVIATAVWEGDAIVITSEADAGGTTITFTEKLTLSNGNRTLTDVLRMATPQGEMAATYCFERL
jgi:hypothetical protein